MSYQEIGLARDLIHSFSEEQVRGLERKNPGTHTKLIALAEHAYSLDTQNSAQLSRVVAIRTILRDFDSAEGLEAGLQNQAKSNILDNSSNSQGHNRRIIESLRAGLSGTQQVEPPEFDSKTSKR